MLSDVKGRKEKEEAVRMIQRFFRKVTLRQKMATKNGAAQSEVMVFVIERVEFWSFFCLYLVAPWQFWQLSLIKNGRTTPNIFFSYKSNLIGLFSAGSRRGR